MRPHLKPIEDQVIIVTGASSGIGLATARLAAERGARVVLAGRSEDGLQRAAEAVRERGEEAVYVIADVAQEADVRRIAETAVREFGGFDTWVSNAGVSAYGRIDEVPLEDQRRVFETNYWGVVHGSLVALDHLRDRGGAIINVGSTLSERAFPLQGAYSAAKHAVKGFTDALRMELLYDRVPVAITLIKPGAIATPYQEHAQNYLPREPRNPPPLYAPEIVARAILHAAEHPMRELTVGGGARMFEFLDHWLPRFTDLLTGHAVSRLQHSREPAKARGPEGLHAGAGDGRERSGDYALVREHSAYTWAATHRGAALGLAIAAGAAVALAGGLMWRRS